MNSGLAALLWLPDGDPGQPRPGHCVNMVTRLLSGTWQLVHQSHNSGDEDKNCWLLASQGSQVSVAQRSGAQQAAAQGSFRAEQASRAEGRVSGTMMGRGQL